MSDLTLLFDEEQEIEDMGSYNHSTVQANVAYLLKGLHKYSVSIELSLDSSSLPSDFNVKDEMIPDVCIYPKRKLEQPFDLLKMTDMPLMVVEVLSPRQNPASLLDKFNAYFALGIQSCWLVDPTTRTVHIYESLTKWKTFRVDEELVDQTLDIHLPAREIFD